MLRRWRRWLVGGLVLLLAVVAVLLLALPALACGWLQRRSPLPLGKHLVLTGAATRGGPPPGHERIRLGLPPGRLAEALQAGLGGWGWGLVVPARVVLSGRDRTPGSLLWCLEGEPAGTRPRLEARPTLEDLNRACAAWSAGESWRLVFGHLHLRDADPVAPGRGALSRSFAFDAHGLVMAFSGSQRLDLPVRALAGRIDLELTPVPGGLRPALRLRLSECDASLSGFGTTQDLRGEIELLTNRRIADRLEGRVWPAWIPSDLAVEVEVGVKPEGLREF